MSKLTPKPALGYFELGRILHAARIAEAWAFNPEIAKQRLEMDPYPAEPSDTVTPSAEVHLAQAQAKALLKAYDVVAR